MQRNLFRAAPVVVFIAILFTGCSAAPKAPDTPTTTQTTEPAEAPVEVTEEPGEVAPTAEPEVQMVDIRAPKLGDKVPAAQVEEVKAAGINGYKSVTGEGEVVKRGTLSEIMKKDYIDVSADDWLGIGSRADFMGAAAREAGVSIVSLSSSAGGQMIVVIIDGVANLEDSGYQYDGKEKARGRADALARKHGIPEVFEY